MIPYTNVQRSTWPSLKKSKVTDTYAYCIICSLDFPIPHGARTDCRWHIDGLRHANFTKLKGVNCQLRMMLKKSDELSTLVLKAEALFIKFLVKHNCPLSIADHSVSYLNLCSRTLPFPRNIPEVKSFAKTIPEAMIETLKSTKFALVTKNSNATTSKKVVPNHCYLQ